MPRVIVYFNPSFRTIFIPKYVFLHLRTTRRADVRTTSVPPYQNIHRGMRSDPHHHPSDPWMPILRYDPRSFRAGGAKRSLKKSLFCDFFRQQIAPYSHHTRITSFGRVYCKKKRRKCFNFDLTDCSPAPTRPRLKNDPNSVMSPRHAISTNFDDLRLS